MLHLQIGGASSSLFQLKNFYLVLRVDEEERLLLPRDVALPREDELLLRCTRELFDELLLERLTCAGALLRWLDCVRLGVARCVVPRLFCRG